MNNTKVMTLNLMSDLNPKSRTSPFSRRAASIEEMVRWHNPDLIGVQELTDNMLKDLEALTETYTFCGRGRSKTKDLSDERCCVLFRKTRYQLIHHETFWLSNQPDEPGSRILGALYPRIATLAVLKDLETNTVFTFCNTHLTFGTPAARTTQSRILRDELHRRRKGEYIVLTGDFNTVSESTASWILSDPLSPLQLVNAEPDNQSSTIRSHLSSFLHDQKPIDHIYLSKGLEVERSIVISSMYMGCFPSDHRPLLVTFHETEKTDVSGS